MKNFEKQWKWFLIKKTSFFFIFRIGPIKYALGTTSDQPWFILWIQKGMFRKLIRIKVRVFKFSFALELGKE
jgi:hypothetical protein